MRLKAAFALSILLVFSAPIGWPDESSGVTNTDPASLSQSALLAKAPDFSEKDIFEKGVVSLKSFRGKVVLLNFWATWCPPCRIETPTLINLQRVHAGQIEVVGVSVYSNNRDTEQFYRDFGINYPMIYGSYELMGAYGKIGAIPTTVVIDKSGRIVRTVVGMRTQNQYEAMLSPLFAQ